MSRAIAITFAVLLAGCAMGPTPEQIAASDDAECRNYGAQPGSQEYFQCRMAKDQQRQQARAALAAAYLSRPQPQPYQLPMPAPAPVNRPINCTSTPMGNSVSTNCY